jgi:hypothetical protein
MGCEQRPAPTPSTTLSDLSESRRAVGPGEAGRRRGSAGVPGPSDEAEARRPEGAAASAPRTPATRPGGRPGPHHRIPTPSCPLTTQVPRPAVGDPAASRDPGHRHRPAHDQDDQAQHAGALRGTHRVVAECRFRRRPAAPRDPRTTRANGPPADRPNRRPRDRMSSWLQEVPTRNDLAGRIPANPPRPRLIRAPPRRRGRVDCRSYQNRYDGQSAGGPGRKFCTDGHKRLPAVAGAGPSREPR